jgi:hypothetical protein
MSAAVDAYAHHSTPASASLDCSSHDSPAQINHRFSRLEIPLPDLFFSSSNPDLLKYSSSLQADIGNCTAAICPHLAATLASCVGSNVAAHHTAYNSASIGTRNFLATATRSSTTEHPTSSSSTATTRRFFGLPPSTFHYRHIIHTQYSYV